MNYVDKGRCMILTTESRLVEPFAINERRLWFSEYLDENRSVSERILIMRTYQLYIYEHSLTVLKVFFLIFLNFFYAICIPFFIMSKLFQAVYTESYIHNDIQCFHC